MKTLAFATTQTWEMSKISFTLLFAVVVVVDVVVVDDVVVVVDVVVDVAVYTK